MFDYAVIIEGLDGLDVENAPARVKRFASQALNRALRQTRTLAGRTMRQQIAFSSRELVGENGKLKIAQFATPSKIEGIIRGNDRPTSLTRFVKGAPTPGRAGVTVEVKTGKRTRLARAFVLKLKNENRGLAVRLRNGESLTNKKVQLRAAFSQGRRRGTASRRSSDFNLYLLYGPSVDQVFDSVRDDVSPQALDFMEKEFLRLTEALL